MTGKSRVFCGDCVHYHDGYSDRYYEHCAKARKRKRSNHRGEWMEADEPGDKNAENDCGDFKAHK